MHTPPGSATGTAFAAFHTEAGFWFAEPKICYRRRISDAQCSGACIILAGVTRIGWGAYLLGVSMIVEQLFAHDDHVGRRGYANLHAITLDREHRHFDHSIQDDRFVRLASQNQ